MSAPARLDVGVVGAGRVGAVLGAALARAGHRVVAASAVSTSSRRRVAHWLAGAAIAEPSQVAKASQLLLVAVPDVALPAVVKGLAEGRNVAPGTLVVHPSGRFGIGVLEPLRELRALPLALHPVMTFVDSDVDLLRLSGAAFGVTAPEELRSVAEALVIEMGGEPVFVPEEARLAYHAALAWGSDYLVTLVACASDLLALFDVESPRRLLAPLLTAALEGALRAGDAAAAGPVARGDGGTVAAHLKELQRCAQELVEAYLALARLTADRALSRGRLDPVAAEVLLDVLAARRPAT